MNVYLLWCDDDDDDDDGGIKFLLNVGKILQDYTASHSRDSNIQSPTREPYIPRSYCNPFQKLYPNLHSQTRTHAGNVSIN